MMALLLLWLYTNVMTVILVYFRKKISSIFDRQYAYLYIITSSIIRRYRVTVEYNYTFVYVCIYELYMNNYYIFIYN